MIKRRAPVIRINAHLTWQVAQDPESGSWVGVCDTLNLTAFGDTFEEFQANALEAMQLLFTDLFDDGELAAFLRENGWRPADDLPPRGKRAPKFDVGFEVKQKAVEDLVPTGA